MSSSFQGTSRYRIRRQLGAGGMGIVYEAVDLQRGAQRVALKLLKNSDPDSMTFLKREFRALADVAHPNLVQLYELVADADAWFFTLEFVEGTDFLTWVRPGIKESSRRAAPTLAMDVTMRRDPTSSGELDVLRLRESLRQLIRGVAALHAKGRLHRDLKPSNVMVSHSGQVKILDFGLVAPLAEGDTLSIGIQNALVGTAAYMAPEQAAGLPLTPAADWYAVGVMLFEALTGYLPFEGSSMQLLLEKQRTPATRVRERVAGSPDDLADLADALLSIDPQQRPGLEALLAAVGETSVTSAPAKLDSGFVGRVEPLRLLREQFERGLDSQPRLLCVVGDSGVGKTALIRHFLDQVAVPRGATVISGRCHERESVPYKALDSAIDALVRWFVALPPQRVDAILPRDAGVLTQMFPALLRVPTFAQAPKRNEQEPALQKRRAINALRELMGRMCDRGPVVVFIDDVQWGDDDSAAVLAELLTPPDPPNVMWILAARELGPAARALPGPVTLIRLLPMSDAESRELATKLQKDIPDARMATLIEEAAGNPFLLQQLLVRSSDSESGLNSVFRTQLNTLDAPERALLEVVAVAGHPILEKVAVDAASIDATQWKCALTLKANHLIRANPEEEGESFEVWHERVRDAVLTSLEPARRAELHARIADSLERLTPDAMDAAATHLQSAGMKERATDALLRAAERARSTFAFDRSARLYQRVLEEASIDDARRRDLVLQVADAWAAAGSSVRAIRAYRQALREPGSQPMSAASAIDINRKILREFVSLKDRKFTHVIPRLRSLLIPVESWVAKVRSRRR